MKSARIITIVAGAAAVLLVATVAIGVSMSHWGPSVPSLSLGQGPHQRTLLVPQQGALLGIKSYATTGSGVSVLEGDTNRVFDLDLSFHTFNEDSTWSDDVFSSNSVKSDLAEGRTPIFSWSPVSESDPGKNLMTDIAAGKLDGYFTSAAKGFASFKKPIMLRFAHEMNGDWYPWSGCTKNNGHLTCDPNAGAEYIAAWRHVHDIFSAAGASNVIWIWCVNGTDFAPAGTMNHHWTDFYPGDAYVDWVGIDKYFTDTTVSRAVAQDSTLGTYLDFASPNPYKDYAGKKPIIIAETSTGGAVSEGQSDSSFDKRPFFQHLVGDLATHPGIKAVVIVDHNSAGHDYRINNDNEANLDAFVEMARSSYFGLRMKDAAGP